MMTELCAETVLDGAWWFRLDPDGIGLEEKWYDLDADRSEVWQQVTVPTCFPLDAPGKGTYEGVGWYWRRVSLPPDWTGTHLVLRFEAVNHDAMVWIDGRLVATNEDAFLPFEVDVTPYLSTGKAAAIVVRADSTRRDDRLPNGVVTPEKRQEGGGGVGLAWYPPGGIVREVSIRSRPALSIEHVRVLGSADGVAEVCICVRNMSDRPARGLAAASIVDPAGREVARTERAGIEAGGGESVLHRLSVRVERPAPWDLSSPSLYEAIVSLYAGAGEAATDRARTRFGFRDIGVAQGKVTLNGTPVFLAGFNRHDDTPRRWVCRDAETARHDLEAIKALGGNYVRLCHYPNDPSVLDLCDEIGLLVMTEIPLFWWRGKDDGETVYERQLSAALRQLEKMIARDGSHPSIAFWSIGNEWHTQRPGVREGADRMFRRIRELDASRLCMHVSDHWRHEFGATDWFDEDDVVPLSGYPRPPTAEWWLAGIDRLRTQYPGKPIVLTELGSSRPDAQMESIRVGVDAAIRGNTTGFAIWCWADYVMPPEAGGKTATFGVVTRDRQPKIPVMDAVKAAFDRAHEQHTLVRNADRR